MSNKLDETIFAKEKDRHWLRDHGYVKGKKMCVIYNGEYYEDCPITDIFEASKKVQLYIPQLDRKVTVHYSMLDEELKPSSILDTLTYMRAKSNQKKAEKATEKYAKTHKNKYYRKASDYYDKAEDQELLATAPHTNKKDAKEYIRKRRDEIDTNRLNDYLNHGIGKEYYED